MSGYFWPRLSTQTNSAMSTCEEIAHKKWDGWRLAFASSSGCMIDSTLGARYGGRAESGIKKAFRQGILTAVLVPRTERYRYPVKVSNLADEDICLN